VRLMLVLPAYAVPQLPGLDKAYIDSRLVYQYIPNVMEWVTSIGLIAIIVLGFSLACKSLPVFEAEEVFSVHEGAKKGLPYLQA